MKFTVLSLFPDLVHSYFACSIAARGVKKGLLAYEAVDIRSFAHDVHRSCDDAPYGGGAGMVMKPDVVAEALHSVQGAGKRVIYPSPSGNPLTSAIMAELAEENELLFVCGRYEGIDQRVLDRYVTDEISIGDYVIASGELAAMVIIDGVMRRVPGVISGESLQQESFERGLLEYPQYTRPEEWDGEQVPEVLLSGHHAKIEEWRFRKSVEKTLRVRPELLEQGRLGKAGLSAEDRRTIMKILDSGGRDGLGKDGRGGAREAGG
jgi:tRNA (guanine37-N1)-methyltransferase